MKTNEILRKEYEMEMDYERRMEMMFDEDERRIKELQELQDIDLGNIKFNEETGEYELEDEEVDDYLNY